MKIQNSKKRPWQNQGKLLRSKGILTLSVLENQEIVIYTGPSPPIPTRKLLKDKEDDKLTKMLVRKEILIEKIETLERFFNWWLCGSIGLTRKQFKRYIIL